MSYYLIIGSSGIGGAETRALKVASYITKTYKIECNFFLNKKLYEAYKENKFTNFLLQNELIKVRVVDAKKRLFLSDDLINLLLKDKRVYKCIKYLPKFLIKRLSWYHFLDKNIPKKEDVKLHCFHGETARLATILLSVNRKVPTNIEITSNRHVNEWAAQFGKCLDQGKKYEFNVTCVSKTVHGNFSKALEAYKLSSNNFYLDYYKGPFLYFPRMYEVDEKKNIIVFGHRLISTKSPILFAQVIHDLYKEGKLNNWKVLIRGKGIQEAKVAEILSHEISNGLVEIGYTNDLQDDLKRSKIFVSLVVTGNFPSNSIFEAMNYNNILLLSNTGITKEKFDFSEAFFCDLKYKSLKKSVLNSISIAEDNTTFEKYSRATHDFYNEMVEKAEYMNKLSLIFSFDAE